MIYENDFVKCVCMIDTRIFVMQMERIIND